MTETCKCFSHKKGMNPNPNLLLIKKNQKRWWSIPSRCLLCCDGGGVYFAPALVKNSSQNSFHLSLP
jgi:hypothetical protein